MEHRAREWTVAMGKVRVGRIEKVVLTYIHYQIVRSYWIAQKAQPGTLWWPRGVRCGKGGKYICVCMVCVCGLVTKLCLTLVTPWTVGSSVNGIFQSRILEWVAISFSRGSSQLRDRTRVSCVAGGLLHCRQILYRLSHQGSPCICVCVCISSVQSLSCVRLFVTPWIAARQASLSITNSWSSLKLTCIESVMPSAISSSVVPFSSCPQSLPSSESFPMSQLFIWGGQSTGVSALASFLPKKSQGWFPSEWPFHIIVWQKPAQHCKAIFFQLKNKSTSRWRARKPRRRMWSSPPLMNT